MSTDAERREVARRLRELEICLFDDGEYIDCGEVEEAIGLVNDDGVWYRADGVMRLADLIEPSESKVKCIAEVKIDGEKLEELVHDAAVELTGIDRDALLALADDLEAQQANKGLRQMGPYMQPGDAANRIREALGVQDA